MDDQARASRRTLAALAGCWLLLLLLVARSAFGDLGAQVVLLVAAVALMVFAYGELSGRPVPRFSRRGAEADPAPTVPDTWRSERWIAEAVERGLRAIDEWRLEQRGV